MKEQSTLVSLTSFCLALVSTKAAFHFSASLLPSSVLIFRSMCKSILLPTRTIGTLYKNTEINYYIKIILRIINRKALTELYRQCPKVCHKLFVLFGSSYSTLQSIRERNHESPCCTEMGICCTRLVRPYPLT